MKLSEEQVKQALRNLTPRELGFYSPAFFTWYYLGFDVPEHQKDWFNYTNQSRHIQLSPRGHGKTTVFCHAFPVWAICYKPDVRILMTSKTSGQANKNLDVVRRELKRNERIKRDFGELLDNPKQDSGAIWCKRTEQGQKLKDPTVEAIGSEGAITGGHFDIIICDDIIDDENTKTNSRMQSLANWFYGTVGQLLESDSQWFVVGTRKHYADIYSELLESPLWSKRVDRAIIKYPDYYEYVYDSEGHLADIDIQGDYEVLWEDEWDIKALLLDRLQTGSILFDREKQNDPAGMKGQFLNYDWLKFYDELPPVDETTFYIGVDLAISEKETADETVFALIGHHRPSNHLYLHEAIHGRWDFPTQQKKLAEYYEQLKRQNMQPAQILVEDNVYQAAFVQQVVENTFLPVKGIKTTKDKSTKMMAIAPYFENGKILVRNTREHGIDSFISQWVQFPYAEHDDILDAVEKAVSNIIDIGSSDIEVITLSDNNNNDNRGQEGEDYVFCQCGEEYGKGSKKYPKVNGICDECGKRIEKVKIWVE